MQHEEMINERIDQLIAEYLSGSLTADALIEKLEPAVGREPDVRP